MYIYLDERNDNVVWRIGEKAIECVMYRWFSWGLG
jgi:hypothetical protein